MRTMRRHRYNPEPDDSRLWRDFILKCLTLQEPIEAAKSADVALAEYRKRFPPPPPDPDDDDLAALDSALSDPDSTGKSL